MNDTRRNSRQPGAASRASGFSLIEMMVAIVIGMLLTAGIITLFSGTSRTNKVQDGLALLQENGRYAMTRIGSDLRMLSGQYCSNFAGSSKATASGPTMSQRAPWLYGGSPLTLPDSAGPITFATAQALSPRVFVQGYDCSTGTCSPAIPAASGIPAVGTADGSRLKGTDVLTIRYITGTGWAVSGDVATPPTCATGGTITLAPKSGDDDPESATPSKPKFAPGDLAFFGDCQNPSLFPVAGYAAPAVITLGTLAPGGAGGGPFCKAGGNRDARVFNFTKNFITVTYYVALRNDTNGDASAGRKIPVLMRRVNGGAANAANGGDEQEIVQGVERLDFLYGVRKADGTIAYMKAGAINAVNDPSCIPPPDGVPPENGCLWRAVKDVEVHALFDTVNDLPLSTSDQAYRYMAPGVGPAPPTGTSPTGLPWGRMMRREFITTVAVRNAN